MKAKDYRDQSSEELELAKVNLTKDLFDLFNELKISKKLDKPHLIREKRRNIAKINTVLREKQKVS